VHILIGGYQLIDLSGIIVNAISDNGNRTQFAAYGDFKEIVKKLETEKFCVFKPPKFGVDDSAINISNNIIGNVFNNYMVAIVPIPGFNYGFFTIVVSFSESEIIVSISKAI
jgi:hypothetical protein